MPRSNAERRSLARVRPSRHHAAGYGQLPPGLQRVQHDFHPITMCISHHHIITYYITRTDRADGCSVTRHWEKNNTGRQEQENDADTCEEQTTTETQDELCCRGEERGLPLKKGAFKPLPKKGSVPELFPFQAEHISPFLLHITSVLLTWLSIRSLVLLLLLTPPR